jgi:hypothetical protein
MRGAFHLALAAFAVLTAGCTTTVDVAFDEAQDFSSYRTWDWLPRGRNVDAVPGEERGLDALASRLVEGELRGRGLARAAGGADFLVGYEQLRVRRTLVTVNETGAHGLLSSHHASPSYLVQATEQRIHVEDHGYLRVVVTDGPRERVVWRGELWARRRGDFARHLPDVVSPLLARFPVGSPTSVPAR